MPSTTKTPQTKDTLNRLAERFEQAGARLRSVAEGLHELEASEIGVEMYPTVRRWLPECERFVAHAEAALRNQQEEEGWFSAGEAVRHAKRQIKKVVKKKGSRRAKP
jgi:hypothetical protein